MRERTHGPAFCFLFLTGSSGCVSATSSLVPAHRAMFIPTGNVYTTKGVQNTAEKSPASAEVEHVAGNYQLINVASNAKYRVQYNGHITWNANGEVTADFYNVRIK